jgi:hypothetical protein
MFSSMLAPAVAGIYDQSQHMNRPVYQKQQKEQEQMMSEFNQWRQHKRTLQQLADQSGGEKEGAAPTYGDMNQAAWDVTKNMAPYVAAASLGAHMLPSLYQEDVGGMARGAATGTGATLGGLGGIMAGTLGGHALANAIAAKYGLNPRVAANVGAIMGGSAGGFLGHTAGRKGVQSLVEPEEERRRYKYGSDKASLVLSILAARRAVKTEKQAAGGREQKRQKGQQKRQAQQLMSAGFDPANPGAAIDAMNKARRRGSAEPDKPTKAKAPVVPAPVEAAPVMPEIAPKPSRVFPEVPGELTSSGTFAGAAERPFPRVSEGSVPTGLEGGLPPLAATIHGPTTPEPMPGMFGRMKAHPMYQGASRFVASPKGKLAIAGALAAAGAGAYWAGRGKRNVEDDTAEQAMAQTV